jgi:hypothetical protein
MKPRTEPMPDPVPYDIKVATVNLVNDRLGTHWLIYEWDRVPMLKVIAELLQQMGEPEPVDPDLLIAREAVRIAGDAFERTPEKYALAAIKLYKAEKDRT